MKRILPYCILILLGALLLGVAGGCKKDKDKPAIPAFKVDRYYPNSGKAGTLVTIEGESFGTDLERYSASISGTAMEVVSVTTSAIVLRAPEKGSTGQLALKYFDRSIEIGNYTYQTLSVQRVFPINGPAGSSVTIKGEGFGSTNSPAAVFINDKEALVISASDTLLIVEVPADAGTGAVKVKVDGAVASGQDFTYQAIENFSPLTGGKNTKVTITGTGFDVQPAGNEVTFNGKPAVVTSATSEKLVVIAPEGVESGPLSVTINGQKTVGQVFTVVAPPAITVVSPLSGPQGVEMTITGSRFSTVIEENKVLLNGVNVTVTSANERELKLIIPGGTGSGMVKVIVNDQEAEGPQFKDQTLGIAAVSPESGLAGTSVKITGTGFSNNPGENIVTFNGVPAIVTSATETELEMTAPTGLSTGELKVVVNGISASAPKTFRRAGVMTLAGGPLSNVLPSTISKIVIDRSKNAFVSTSTQILKITPDGTTVTVFAGSSTGESGNNNGTGTEARFNYIQGLVIDANDNLYVMDGGLRKITPAGVVTTVSISFTGSSLLLAPDGSFYTTRGFSGISRYTVNGITLVTGHSVNDACRPAIDNAGNVYISKDFYEAHVSYIPKGTTPGTYPRLLTGNPGNPAWQDGPFSTALLGFGINGLLTDNSNNLYILDPVNYAIRKADLTAREVTTVIKGNNGYEDGSFDQAKFGYGITDMAMDQDGNFYVVDKVNKAIRKIFLQ